MKQHLKTSMESIKRAPFQALAAVSVLAVTFFVTTLLSIVIFSSNQIIKYFETRPQVIAFLNEDATDEEINILQMRLESDQRVKSSKLVTKKEALAIYKKATADKPLLGELVSPSIFPASLEFSVVDLTLVQEVIDEISEEGVVESVGFTAAIGNDVNLVDVVERLKTITLYVRISGIVAAAVLALTSLIVLMVVIGMRITMRREEIESLNLIGATPWFIRAPIVLEAINYAITGVVIGWATASVIIMYSTPSIMKYFGEVPVLPQESSVFFAFLGLILAGELVVGVIIAVVASMSSVSRSIKNRK